MNNNYSGDKIKLIWIIIISEGVISMPVYNKLVRDKIPEIIENSGKKAITTVLNDEEYLTELDRKLNEECAEYQQDKSIEELADMLEVIYAITLARGYSVGELEQVRRDKAEKCGGFNDRIFLKEVME